MALLRLEEIRERVGAVNEVATLPAALTRILTITRDPHSTSLDLANEIGQDPALTMKVLRVVNSSFYGFSRRIQTVSDAVVLLGFTEVERLALAISVINLFGGARDRERSLGQLWKHSLAASHAAEVIAHEYDEGRDVAGAHVAALLHDIGKAVIWQALPEAGPRIAQLMAEEGLSAFEAEAQVLDGITHCEVGSWLAGQWSLPESLSQSIALHHTPEEAGEENPLVPITHLANGVCHDFGIHAESYPKPAAPQEGPENTHQLDDELFGRIGARVTKQRGIMGAVSASAM